MIFMDKITISYKTTNILIEELKKTRKYWNIKEGNFLVLYFLKKYADVYFHTGNLDEKSIENIINSKITNKFFCFNESNYCKKKQNFSWKNKSNLSFYKYWK